MKKGPTKWVVILGFTMFFSHCNQLNNDWKKDSYSGRSFDRIAIVGISPYNEEKDFYEDRVMELFSTHNIPTIKGGNLLSEEQLANGSGIEEVLSINELDAVITLSLIKSPIDSDVPYPENYGELSKFFTSRYSQVHTASYYLLSRRYVMEAVLYDLKENGDKMVWKGEMAILDPLRNKEAKDRFLRRMVKHLIAQEVVLKK